ncbi:24098_t:CDS:2 [Gigaspora margarita]|uniref:24098_t:CDS:1 n=1 Tax=Gigaspora margarita TaxID=4874 RepID=A0ABM8VY47_GIGMA|nr:24098_t:CDS:2 [Gigaspora margarita]
MVKYTTLSSAAKVVVKEPYIAVSVCWGNDRELYKCFLGNLRRLD